MINDRILQLIEIKSNGNKRAFAQRIGVASSSIDNVVGSRQSKPNFDLLEKILSSFEDVDANWLMLGKGKEEWEQDSTSIAQSSSTHASEAEFFKALADERKEEIQNKEKEIARLNILVGRYEERLTIFQSGKDPVAPHGVSVSLDDPRNDSRASAMQELPISPQGSGDPLGSYSTNPDE